MKHLRVMLATLATTMLLTSTVTQAQPFYSCGNCYWEYLQCVRAGDLDESECYVRYEDCQRWNLCMDP